MTLQDKSILLIISGGIAAYRALEMIRLLRKTGAQTRCILTSGGANFVTPLSVAALSENEVHHDLWSLKDEAEMRHIRLSREADIILVCPASANLMARMAHGRADDLATATLLAADKPVYLAPAMNHMMWQHPATQSNIATLKERGVKLIGPDHGDMACGEHGPGRLAEIEDILETLQTHFAPGPLTGYKALVTSGPTFEAIDPVRFLGNRSTGRQGHAIAEALRDAGADVHLITGPASLPDPEGMHITRVESADRMLHECETSLPCDIAICAAAVCDWQVEGINRHKLKKSKASKTLNLNFRQTPDILHTLATHDTRPGLIIGFAAESRDLERAMQEKLEEKKCDWLVGNLVGDGKGFGDVENGIICMRKNTAGQLSQEEWPPASKPDIAQKLISRIVEHLKSGS